MIDYPIPIFIPFVNRPDLLQKAVASVPFDERWFVSIIDNSNGQVPSELPFDVWTGIRKPSVSLTASQSLNWMHNIARISVDEDGPHPFYFFMHNDAEAGPGTVEKLYEMAVEKTERGDKWGVIFTHYDTLAAFNTAAFDAVGPWDQNFTQYFVDNDMYRRLRLAGYELAESCLPVKHEGSQTIHSDPIRELYNSISFPIYLNYYIAKWGGEPGHEIYERPFNQ